MQRCDLQPTLEDAKRSIRIRMPAFPQRVRKKGKQQQQQQQKRRLLLTNPKTYLQVQGAIVHFPCVHPHIFLNRIDLNLAPPALVLPELSIWFHHELQRPLNHCGRNVYTHVARSASTKCEASQYNFLNVCFGHVALGIRVRYESRLNESKNSFSLPSLPFLPS